MVIGYFLVSTGTSALPLILSLVQANVRGISKRMSMTALIFSGYCGGNMVGPQLFQESEADAHYPTAIRAILTCYVATGLLATSLGCYLECANRRRDELAARRQKMKTMAVGNADNHDGESEASRTFVEGAEGLDLMMTGGGNKSRKTDWQADFRYRV